MTNKNCKEHPEYAAASCLACIVMLLEDLKKRFPEVPSGPERK